MFVSKYLVLATMSATILCGCSGLETISIHNPYSQDRCGYIAEIEAESFPEKFKAGFIVENESGDYVPYQLTYDGKLLIETDVKAGQTVTFKLRPDESPTFDTICLSQIRYDFQDDLTWENDKGGYRLYGPAYKNGGGNVSGYDIWTKSVSFPVLAQRYHDHCRHGISYHKDHGNGMDAYTVGRTLGAGMNAIIENGEIAYPCAYERCEIMDNGPLRTTAKITCCPLDIGYEYVIETRIITLDKGSWLNKTRVKYDGLSSKKQMVTGIVVHKQNPSGLYISPDKVYAAYADLTDNPENGNGVIYIGIVNHIIPDSISYTPFNPAVGDAVGQIINHTIYAPGKEYIYYWGAGWSKGGVNGMEAWMKYLADFKQSLETPLEISVK